MINKTITINNPAGVTVTAISVVLTNTDSTTLSLSATPSTPGTEPLYSSTLTVSSSLITLSTLFGNPGVTGLFTITFMSGSSTCSKTFTVLNLYEPLSLSTTFIFDIGNFT